MDVSHLRKLSSVVFDAQRDFDLDAEREQRRTERQREIDAVPDVKSEQFWCAGCNRDFQRIARKRVTGGGNRELRAVYEAKCPSERHWCERRITDRSTDPYWSESRLVALERRRMERDLIQPGDPRFNRIYGDPNKRVYEKLERDERKSFDSNRKKGYGTW